MTSQVTLERDFELLNLEVDGALSGADRAELGRRLLADPSLRALRDSLRRTCAALDALPEEEPPADLTADAIVSNLPARPRPADGTRARPQLRFTRITWRHAAAIAGAAIVSVLAFQATHVPGTSGLRDLAGTVAPVEPARIELQDHRGTIEVRGPAAAPTVQARLTTDRPVFVVARLGDHEVRLDEFAAVQGESVATASFPLPAQAAGSGVIEVQVVDAATGEVLEAARLRPFQASSK
jgi:hypothetical protein